MGGESGSFGSGSAEEPGRAWNGTPDPSFDPGHVGYGAPQPWSDPADESHLRMLRVGHYVYAGLHLCGLGLVWLHSLFTREMSDQLRAQLDAARQSAEAARQEAIAQGQAVPPAPPAMPSTMLPFEFMDRFLLVVYVLSVVVLLASLVANVVAGHAIGARRRRTFVLVLAGWNCLNFPFGLVLGVFTFVVLLRESVARRFRA